MQSCLLPYDVIGLHLTACYLSSQTWESLEACMYSWQSVHVGTGMKNSEEKE